MNWRSRSRNSPGCQSISVARAGSGSGRRPRGRRSAARRRAPACHCSTSHRTGPRRARPARPTRTGARRGDGRAAGMLAQPVVQLARACAPPKRVGASKASCVARRSSRPRSAARRWRPAQVVRGVADHQRARPSTPNSRISSCSISADRACWRLVGGARGVEQGPAARPAQRLVQPAAVLPVATPSQWWRAFRSFSIQRARNSIRSCWWPVVVAVARPSSGIALGRQIGRGVAQKRAPPPAPGR